MDRFDVNILGCGSATPTSRHMTTCQVVNHRERLMMIDCGEGAQINMRRMRLKFTRLANIFISHLHGDHVFGLPGLLSTMGLHDKGGSVTIHTFSEGREVLQPFLNYFYRDTNLRIDFNIITPNSGIIYEDSGLTVETFPLYHRVECTGFIFREKPRLRTYLAEMGEFHGVPRHQIAAIKEGADFVKPDGTVVANRLLTRDPAAPLSYAYCSDTMADRRVAKAVEGVDMIYHEATYTDAMATLARSRGHSTAAQAARIAAEAGAKWLVIGHYSKRYDDERVLVDEARKIFPNTIGARELMTIPVGNPEQAIRK